MYGSFRHHSSSFRSILVSFRFIPVHSGSFRFIPVPFRFIQSGTIPVYSCTIPVHSGIIPVYSGIIPVHSGSFLLIPFSSVPVFSNALPVHNYYIASGLLPGNLGGGVQPTSGNPNPISNLTEIKLCDFPFPISDRTQNSIPYFRPDPYPILLA